MTASYVCDCNSLLKSQRCWRVSAPNQFLRQRRIATGITLSTAGCQLGIWAKPSSTTQSNEIPGMAFIASVKAGSVCRTSPMDDVLTISTRISAPFLRLKVVTVPDKPAQAEYRSGFDDSPVLHRLYAPCDNQR